jgi:DnaJ-class molecular chaperone
MEWYTILGISKTSTLEEVNKAFKAEALKCHPDKPGGSHEKFLELTTVYKEAVVYVKTHPTNKNPHRQSQNPQAMREADDLINNAFDILTSMGIDISELKLPVIPTETREQYNTRMKNEGDDLMRRAYSMLFKTVDATYFSK